MQVGVFGGTFSPVHLGHLRAAEEVGEALGLDRVVFVPAKVPPHKGAATIAPPEVRLEMVRRAVAGNPRFEVSDLELRREGPSYSVDTLRRILAELAPGDRLWFLVGTDAFREIHTWYRCEELFALADVAVMSRPPESPDPSPPSTLSAQFRPRPRGYVHDSGREVRFVSVTLLDISSTQVRQTLAQGRSVRYLVPDAVLPYLEATAAEHPDWFVGSNP